MNYYVSDEKIKRNCPINQTDILWEPIKHLTNTVDLLNIALYFHDVKTCLFANYIYLSWKQNKYDLGKGESNLSPFVSLSASAFDSFKGMIEFKRYIFFFILALISIYNL